MAEATASSEGNPVELRCAHRHVNGTSALIVGGFYFDWQCRLCGLTDMDAAPTASATPLHESVSGQPSSDFSTTTDLASVDFTRKS